MTRGTVVLVRFPFSDLSAAKLRPAIVLADAGRGDVVLVQVTSNPYSDSGAIQVDDADFAAGSLDRVSFVRPGKLFTASSALVARPVGTLSEETMERIVDAVIRLLRGA